MSAVISIVNSQIRNIISFISLTNSYFKKKNPLMAAVSNALKSIYIFLTSGKRLKVLKYQVQLMYYRMHQMEKLIQENNPNNSLGGHTLNKYR